MNQLPFNHNPTTKWRICWKHAKVNVKQNLHIPAYAAATSTWITMNNGPVHNITLFERNSKRHGLFMVNVWLLWGNTTIVCLQKWSDMSKKNVSSTQHCLTQKKKRQTGKFSRKRKPFTRKQLCSVTPTVSIFLAESWNPTVRLIAETLPSPCVIWYFSCTGFNWRTPVEGCQKKGSTGQSDRESHSPNRLRALKFVA